VSGKVALYQDPERSDEPFTPIKLALPARKEVSFETPELKRAGASPPQ
jgi:hypothetical protein